MKDKIVKSIQEEVSTYFRIWQMHKLNKMLLKELIVDHYNTQKPNAGSEDT